MLAPKPQQVSALVDATQTIGSQTHRHGVFFRLCYCQLSRQKRSYRDPITRNAGLSDPIRVEIPAAIKECHEAGIRVIMITGDSTTISRPSCLRFGWVAVFSTICKSQCPTCSLCIFRSRALLWCRCSLASRRCCFRCTSRSLRRPNKTLWLVAVGTVALLAVVIEVPVLFKLFRFDTPAPLELPAVVGLGVLSALWFELVRWSRARAGPKVASATAIN